MRPSKPKRPRDVLSLGHFCFQTHHNQAAHVPLPTFRVAARVSARRPARQTVVLSDATSDTRWPSRPGLTQRLGPMRKPTASCLKGLTMRSEHSQLHGNPGLRTGLALVSRSEQPPAEKTVALGDHADADPLERCDPTPHRIPDHLWSASTQPANLERHDSDRAKTPGCPTGRFACAPIIATEYREGLPASRTRQARACGG